MADTISELVAILMVAPEQLADLLQLPEGSCIDSVHAPHDRPGVLELRIRGAGWVTRAGDMIQKTTGIVTSYHAEDGSVLRHVIDWRLPHG